MAATGSLRRRLALLLLLVPVAMAPVFWASLRLQPRSRMVTHTHEVFESLSAARAALRQATGTFHDYLASGDPALVPQYRGSVHAAWKEVWRFKELTADNPRQVAGTARLEQRIADLFRFQDELIAQRAQGLERTPAARIVAESGVSEQLSLALRGLIEEERRLLGVRSQDVEAGIRIIWWSAAVTLLLQLALARFIWVCVESEIREMRRLGG